MDSQYLFWKQLAYGLLVSMAIIPLVIIYLHLFRFVSDCSLWSAWPLYCIAEDLVRSYFLLIALVLSLAVAAAILKYEKQPSNRLFIMTALIPLLVLAFAYWNDVHQISVLLKGQPLYMTDRLGRYTMMEMVYDFLWIGSIATLGAILGHRLHNKFENPQS